MTTGDVEEIRQEYAFEHLDKMCDMQGVEPAELAAQPDATLVEWARAAAPPAARNGPVDVSVLRKDLPAYVAACNECLRPSERS